MNGETVEKKRGKIKKPRVLGEFKEFISRGNVMDLAVGVIIGGAFSKIVTSLVNDIVMPFIGFITGNVNVAELKIVLRPGDTANNISELVFRYGAFIQTVIDFLLIALVIFFLVKGINALRRKKKEAPAAPAAPPEDIRLLTEIRDLLKEKKEN
jgi:large conductance mechanosensitive channel